MQGSGLNAATVRTWGRSGLRYGVMAVLWLLSLALPALTPPAHAQGLESVLSPGKLSQAHAKWEGDCKSCHVRFDRNGQDRLCMDCHKETAQDVQARTGHHGRMKPQQCRTCHTEHRGLGGKLTNLDEKRFDHSVTDFALRGKHQQVDCGKCHAPGKKRRSTPQDCYSCHRKDDNHKGNLGTRCGDCHTENSWKDRKFDHSKTRFPLEGRHNETKCGDCHRNNQYRDQTPRDCYGCHKKDDDQDGHRGQFGTRCETCHTPRRWDEQIFDHDQDTDYPLVGKHRTTACTDCHSGPLYAVKLSQACFDCHKKDDKHRESLGRDCGKCHTERGWKQPAKFDHDRTRFPLRNAHANPRVTCESCHRDLSSMRNTPRDCYSCHRTDDKHDGQNGRECEKCHDDRSWRVGTFDHNKTRFPLTGRHAANTCKDCHKTQRFKDVKPECYSCHKKDDKHQGKFGPKCESCHSTRAWPIWNFDHNKRTDFKLDGGHVKTPCERCHTREAPAGAAVAPLGDTCVSCHRKDDTHDGAFGTRCESCHSTESWRKTTRLRTSGGTFHPGEAAPAALVLGQTSYFTSREAGSGPGTRWLQ
jgi:hypothetical protein